MVVVMLAAEEPCASTPRKGMDCVGKANTANKKLVQARLPFKRLNPEPKECSESKRTKGPVALKCSEPSASDGENEMDHSSLLLHHGPALVNGRGPLDCFMSRRKHSPIRSAPEATVDLTEDSTDAPVPPVAATCPISEETTKTAEHTPQSTGPTTPLTEKDEDDGEILPLMDTTQESDSEEEEQQEADVSQGNESVLSAESTSSLSVVESSPEPSKSAPTTPASALRTNTVKRRSLKNVQEQEERQRQKEEKERQRQDAKAAKEKKREEARKLKEEREREKKEKKERDEKERREKKEKEEKEKAEKIRAKEEQRQMKIEAKLEEKRKKEEEKRLKEEKERIKAEKAEITRFLQKPKTQLAPKTLASACGKFAPFEIREYMFLAPLTRVQCEDAVLEELDHYLAQPDSTLNGLKDWMSHKPRRSGPTRPRCIDAGSDCLVVSESLKENDGVPERRRFGRMKLLHFHDNYRPAYWGTWSKKSACISPRCPLRQDKELLDYEVDSDEEWEEDEPGESLSHSEGDDDDEGGDDDDDDDGFFVPHGYLSEGEGALEDEEGGDPEKQKVRQRMKAREWENELLSKGKVKVLEAVVRGCLWEGKEPPLDLLQPYAVCILEPLPRDESCTPEQDVSRQQRNEKLLSQLLPLLHGNVNSSKIIISEFLEFCRQQTSSPTETPLSSTENVPPRIHIRRLIKENAVYEKRSTYRRCCWYVHAEVLARYSQEALPVPCQWTYLTTGAQMTRDEATGSQGNSPTTSSSTTPSNKRKSASSHSITKYMKKCGDSEQTEAMETDGFQADTEDDDDDDCVIVGEQSGSSEQDANTSLAQTERNTEPMDTNASETAALVLPCLTSATA
ncbi:chromatin assembly factor 1 subunit A-like [Myxocyprinus asiaticus]|uniref:chromatin assembly factor 1 subunit A-like n=1 Tax=Myxocyprinus asiaticus TaxID=70543 RepID=UPI002223E202|nr:chromatin assembly factor 1 subunit A-like [Myxocyprinus asiaticus]